MFCKAYRIVEGTDVKGRYELGEQHKKHFPKPYEIKLRKTCRTN
jgi:hypothetical protein